MRRFDAGLDLGRPLSSGLLLQALARHHRQLAHQMDEPTVTEHRRKDL